MKIHTETIQRSEISSEAIEEYALKNPGIPPRMNIKEQYKEYGFNSEEDLQTLCRSYKITIGGGGHGKKAWVSVPALLVAIARDIRDVREHNIRMSQKEVMLNR